MSHLISAKSAKAGIQTAEADASRMAALAPERLSAIIGVIAFINACVLLRVFVSSLLKLPWPDWEDDFHTSESRRRSSDGLAELEESVD